MVSLESQTSRSNCVEINSPLHEALFLPDLLHPRWMRKPRCHKVQARPSITRGWNVRIHYGGVPWLAQTVWQPNRNVGKCECHLMQNTKVRLQEIMVGWGSWDEHFNQFTLPSLLLLQEINGRWTNFCIQSYGLVDKAPMNEVVCPVRRVLFSLIPPVDDSRKARGRHCGIQLLGDGWTWTSSVAVGKRMGALFFESRVIYACMIPHWKTHTHICIINTENITSYWCCLWDMTHRKGWGGVLPLIFCIHMRSRPIYQGPIYLAK